MKMSKVGKDKILKIVAKIGRTSAIKANSASSAFCCYQPDVPKTLRSIKK